jgi:hypothetical protein
MGLYDGHWSTSKKTETVLRAALIEGVEGKKTICEKNTIHTIGTYFYILLKKNIIFKQCCGYGFIPDTDPGFDGQTLQKIQLKCLQPSKNIQHFKR